MRPESKNEPQPPLTKRARKASNADALLDEEAAAADRRRRRRDMFGDCALVEIIHLHDCLRGALSALQRDVSDLSDSLREQRLKPAAAGRAAKAEGGDVGDDDDAVPVPTIDEVADIERRVAGRFKVIWSVFQAHSAAEDEFIWPALQKKQSYADGNATEQNKKEGNNSEPNVDAPANVGGGVATAAVIEQEEYEEEHANEERMFETMDSLLTRLRTGLSEQRRRSSSDAVAADMATTTAAFSSSSSAASATSGDPEVEVHEMAEKIDEITSHLKEHLLQHLDKEETHCMPLVVKHLNKDEIHDLVGQIMGKRSSDQMCDIMTMAVQNLSPADRDEMVRYMKQAMVGTFFERWLTMSGWMSSENGKEPKGDGDEEDSKPSAAELKEGVGVEKEGTASDACPLKGDVDASSSSATCSVCSSAGRCLKADGDGPDDPSSGDMASVPATSAAAAAVASAATSSDDALPEVTTPEELEKLIRAVAQNPELSAIQKSMTIQGLRDSVWKSQMEHKRKLEEMNETSTAAAPAARGARRVTPPSSYWRKKRHDGSVELIWSCDSPHSRVPPEDRNVPLFSASELAPTYFDGATSAVLGCPHYARSCKVRHPASGRLYTCRLCCEQEREMPMKDQDSPLDRYEVSEVLCMKCGALQPFAEKCCNPKCQSGGKPFARWCCKICHLYDDSPKKNIYHCPFCNVCRAGRGLGIDYRHCMRCNACVTLSTAVTHTCIPQRLSGNCPICHEAMFESTKPLRGLRCGHVMHLSCFGMYLRGGQWTCPLCKKSVDDMKEYFAMLDMAVRMQPMPAAYAETMSNIYCQDCGKSGVVPYHFVGMKCSHCGSYNTRELSRVDSTSSS